METEPAPESKADQAPESPSGPTPRRTPILTLLACAASILLFLAIATEGSEPSWGALAKWGYLSPYRIWDGAYWGLVSSAFVHLALWHLAFNVYWLWHLGGVVETTLGPLKWLTFVLGSAIVSSAIQLGASGSTGHGASGVVYALFGLMWASRSRVPAFALALGERTAPLFWIWLVGSLVATRLGVAEIGNAAHIAGLLLGVLVAHWLILKTRRHLAYVATALLVGTSLVPLFWSPWSSTWVGYKAYKAHLAGEYDGAVAGYRKSVALGGNRVWALRNLALVYRSKGADKEYSATLAELRGLDPAAAAKLEEKITDPGSARSEGAK